MAQNTSHAVMAQRSEPHDSLDDFPTPPWGTRAFVERVLWPDCNVVDPRAYARTLSVWDPACNRGFMVRPLREYFGTVHASDVHDYGNPCQQRVSDFLFPGSEPAVVAAEGVDWIITNPPFRLAESFIERAFAVGARNLAMLVRTAFLEGCGRYDRLFRLNPPSVVAQFTERLPMVRGRCDPKASTATAYCWLAWMEGEEGTRMLWIPPCRKHLERPGDYDDGAPRAEAGAA